MRTLVWLAVGLFLLPSADARAQSRDKVTLRIAGGGLIRDPCDIVDYTGRTISYRKRDDGPLVVKPASEVVAIETQLTQEQVNGKKYLAQGKTDDAVGALETALRQEPREWVRRDILSLLVQCALRKNDYAQAGSRFLPIVESDESTPHFKMIPLLWTATAPDDKLRAVAERWLTAREPHARLMGAASLLFDRDRKAAAENELRQLGVTSDTRVQRLSQVQLWRLNLRSGELDDSKLGRWLTSIDSVPEELRGGAWFVLGEARKRRQQYDRAASSLLWVSMVYDHDYQLAALANLHAADALRSIGQHTSAETLYRDTLQRFGESDSAQDAKQALEEMSSPKIR